MQWCFLQERFAKSILFILSLQCYACQPSLIITTSGSLPLWQSAFGRLAPSLNVVMYEGDKDVRKIIRNLEFYEESGCLTFQVLLADHEAIIEVCVSLVSILYAYQSTFAWIINKSFHVQLPTCFCMIFFS